MRKLRLQVQMTLDGYMESLNSEMDWMTFHWDEELFRYVQEITNPVDCIVLGRKLAKGFIPHWAQVAGNPADPEYAASRKFTDTPKIVFTRTLSQFPCENTVLASQDLTLEIIHLKKQAGHDIITYGGATFVASLIKNRLINDFYLFINPVVIGQGMPLFQELAGKQNLHLVRSTAFNCGIVVLHY